MPDGPWHLCTMPRCRRLLARGERCPDHSPPWGITPDRPPFADRYGAGWEARRQRILTRDGRRCQACMRFGLQTPATHVDHIVPKSSGGADLDTNLEALCERCHFRKSARERRRG